MSNVKCQKFSGGYSLIELLVAVSVFATVVAITSGTFIVSLKGQKKSFTVQNVADNIRYTTEVMAKELRMGENFAADTNGGACSTLCRITFRSNMPHRVPPYVVGPNATQEFYLSGNQIFFDDEVGAGPAAGAITSLNVTVNSLAFEVSGAPPASQPRVTFVIEAESSGSTPDVTTRIDVQTTISQRSL